MTIGFLLAKVSKNRLMLMTSSSLHYFSFLAIIQISSYPLHEINSANLFKGKFRIDTFNSPSFLIADEDPSKGWSFCNHSKYPRIEVAVGYTIGDKRISVGWRSALSKQCAKPIDGSRPDGLAYYAVARNSKGQITKEWAGSSNNKKFCVQHGEPFKVIVQGSNPLSDNCTILKPFIPIPKSDMPILTTIIK